jgi:pimeloyl-ACP methyl ester carboxylesterase
MPSAGRLRYLEAPAKLQAGAGPSPRALGTLVLLHAFPLNARMWEPQLALAEHGWRVIVPQLRGFDGGHHDPPAASVDDYAGDLVDLLDTLHVERAVIGGCSMGGYVAFALLRLAPTYVGGLILADTRSQADTPEGRQGREKMLALLAAKGPGGIADEMMPKLLGETTRREHPALAERVRALIMASSNEAIAGAIRALMTRPDSTPLLHPLHLPTLIVVGEEDTLTPPALSQEMHQAVHGSQLVVIPKAGHLSSLEQPEAFNAAVLTFLTTRA